jgi:ABC-type antimicrobial peptide transport system permease subunit
MLLAFLMASLWSPTIFTASAQSQATIYGTVVDAKTGLPIASATVLFWNTETLNPPTPDAGLYKTDQNGQYAVSGSYLKAGVTYWAYAYHGDLEAKDIDYIPSSRREIRLETLAQTEVSFALVPGAIVEWEGAPYLVQSSSPEDRAVRMEVVTDPPLDEGVIKIYGASDVWFIGLDSRTAIVPADTPFVLEATVWYFSNVTGVEFGREVFRIYNGSLPFMLSQGDRISFTITRYSLQRGVEYAEARYIEVSSRLDLAQNIGFVVFDDRSSLENTYNRLIVPASSSLRNARTDDDFLEVWQIIRQALFEIGQVSDDINRKYDVARSSAAYLSAIMAVFSVVLAFFFTENSRKKLYYSVVIYILFLVALYFLYPGAHIVIDENIVLFLQSAGISFLGVLAIVFGIPQVWKERKIEGEVTWRSAITLLFSMGKRQIKRKRIRGFFTIASNVILILAFTSLTSFGVAYGIVSEELNVSAPANGVIIKRMVNATSLQFIALGFEDPAILNKSVSISNVAERIMNFPSQNPVARLVNPITGGGWFIYGVLGITPSTEARYTQIDQTVQEGRYLGDTDSDKALIATSVATLLGIEVGQNLTLEIIGTRVSRTVTVVGLIGESGYTNLVDVDGSEFGPARFAEDGSERRCNGTEIIVLNAATARNIQDTIDEWQGQSARPLLNPSSFVFQLAEGADINSAVWTMISIFDYDVFISSSGVVTYYHIGEFIELKGAAELIIPLIMVGLNVGMVMMNAVYERRKEIRTLSMLGLNPTHIGLTFVAEAIILGMVGGSLGYLFGLGFYRIMVLFGQQLMVREKLEWWWSALGFALALAASVLSSLRPAALAVSTYTPSRVKKVKRTEEETKERKEEIFKVYQERQLSMPVRVQSNEVEFFISFMLDRLNELKTGYLERVKNVEVVPETENVRGEFVRAINFDYAYGTLGRERGTENQLIMTKSPDEDYYRVRLVTEPSVPGLPESVIERTINFIHDAILFWAKEKDRIISSI